VFMDASCFSSHSLFVYCSNFIGIFVGQLLDRPYFIFRVSVNVRDAQMSFGKVCVLLRQLFFKSDLSDLECKGSCISFLKIYAFGRFSNIW
jgi:hypothetical protein